uniref:EGF-like domain-containing protein n=1 Tax=Branchiostoma floridae TaxID=7739 RepID=C3Z3I5_BRAFL|eukprot:XP_002597017.1 hypothetical protein BRAFLDRAFT_215849 [Branchiostoma floridae]
MFLFIVLSPKDANECSSDPCQNGATCHDELNSYTCACVAGWEGIHCNNGKPNKLPFYKMKTDNN